MNESYRRVSTFGFALLASISIGACSGDEDGQPQGAKVAEAATPAAPAQADRTRAGRSSQATVEGTGDEWTLRVRNGSYLSTVLPGMYRERCLEVERVDERQCSFLRSLLVVEITMALEQIERSRDQRGADEALAALQLDEEPSVLIAAMRVLGQFPDTPGITDKVLPLMLESPFLMVQQTAASLLGRNSDPVLAAIGALWGGNHASLYAKHEYFEYPDFAPDYLDMEFPDYPDAEWFSPADSDRSVGWSTGDDFATVTAWLSAELGAEGLTYQQWGERLAQESMAVFQAIDPGKQAEMERLIEEWTATLDPAVMEKLHKLQEEMYAPVEAAGEMADKGVASLAPPIATEAQEQVRFFVAEERAGHVARMVMVYPLSSLGRTVIQHAWSLADYPSAWPPTEEDTAQDQ